MGWKYCHLGIADRARIEGHLEAGRKPSAIAGLLGRSRSTITREIERNGWRGLHRATRGRVYGRYRAAPAERQARRLERKPRVGRKLRPDTPLWPMVLDRLQQGLSPQQIAGTLRRMPVPVRISHETIYTTLYAMPRGKLRDRVLLLLRRQRKARRSRTAPVDRRSKSIPGMVLIDQRPDEINRRIVPGHWEGDLLIGQRNRSQIGTLVERSTLFVALVKLENGRSVTVADGFATIFERFTSQQRRSMTYDQGTEMRHHALLTERTGVEVFFAHPHAPWERGIAENTNGLLRQYLPKGTDLSVFSQNELDDIAWKLNTRPRKTLNWRAPAELFLPKGDFDFQHFYSNLKPFQ